MRSNPQQSGRILRWGLTFVLLACASNAYAVVRPCATRGMERTKSGHCCWPEQRWSESRAHCVGIPSCGPGFVAVDEHCKADRDQDERADEADSCPLAPEDLDGFDDEDGCPDPDNDHDGVCDEWVTESEHERFGCVGVDACPDDPEDFDAVEDDDGCPDITVDRDGDGLPDEQDRCATLGEDFDGIDDDDGCPDIDHDGDGVCDQGGRYLFALLTNEATQLGCRGLDRCPGRAGSPEARLAGCPLVDRDGDQLCDPWVARAELHVSPLCSRTDECPDQAEDLDGDQDHDGCPDAALPIAPPTDPLEGSDVWAWSALGTGVAFALGAGTLHWLAEDERARVTDAVRTPGGAIDSISQRDAEAAEVKANQLDVGAAVALSAGLALCGAGALIFLLTDEQNALPGEVTVAPTGLRVTF